MKAIWSALLKRFQQVDQSDPLPKDARIGPLDYVLSAAAAGLAVYSAGMGLLLTSISTFFVVLVLVGTAVSFVLQRLLPERAQRWDGLLYVLAGAIAITQARELNGLLAEGGFPRQLMLAGVLCWMLALGSLALWRDMSLLFQAVPSIALFGLVGTWDTFRGSIFAFFGFLLCFAALFARAHRRQMLSLAILSGYPRVDDIRRGPWRWMAGPEWALGSATVILLLSFLGAPLFQQSVQGIAGTMRVPAPPTPQTSGSSSDPFRVSDNSVISRIGLGPSEVTEAILMYVTMDEQRYLRSRTYGRYESRGWVIVNDFANRNEIATALLNPNSELNLSREALSNAQSMPFKIEPVQPLVSSLPIPGELESLSGNLSYGLRPDGTISLFSRVTGGEPIQGIVRIPSPDAAVRDTATKVSEIYTDIHELDPIPQRVRELAKEVVQGLETDIDKAKAIKRAIEERVRYNLNAPATPQGADPVEHFLFVSKEGYCDVFASAMVLMARSVGLPARYTTGYYTRVTDMDSQGRFRVREADAHSWAEIFFEGVGWIVFDPTEGAIAVPGGERGTATASLAWYQRTWVQWILGALAAALLSLTLFKLGGLVRKKVLLKQSPQRRLNKLYADFIGALERQTGKPKRPSQTPFEYFDTIEPLLPVAQDGIAEATEAFVQSFYAPEPAGSEEVEELRTKVKGLLLELRQAGKSKSIMALDGLRRR